MSQNQGYPDFNEYIRQGEPSKREAAYAWSTAIGLQAVDGLSPAISEGYVRLLYPEKPHHPRQKYLLTVKGSLLFNELINLEN